MTSAGGCPDAVLLRQYAQGQLSGQLAEEVARHLPDCPGCQRIVEPSREDIVPISSGAPTHSTGISGESSPGATGAWEVAPGSGEGGTAIYQPENPAAPIPEGAGHPQTVADPASPGPAGGTVAAGTQVWGTDLSRAGGDSSSGSSGSRPSLPGLPKRSLSSAALVRGKERYLLQREFARGGLGCVWLGRDQHIARDVAIKELLPNALAKPALVERFFIEAQVTGQLEHPGIVPIYELGVKSDGSPFYSMKLLGGRTYADAIHEYHALPAGDPSRVLRLKELLDVFVGICNALAFAHNKGVLHRDLKPLNVMLGDFGEAIVVDWGLAKIMGQPESPAGTLERVDSGDATGVLTGVVRTTAETSQSKTVVGAVMGTPAYMSPEQAEGRVDVMDARSDIYSLGAILYEILVGRPPFRGKDPIDTIIKVRSGKFEPPRTVHRGVAAALAAICLKAMAFEPHRRYQSALELGEEIKRWQAGEPIAAWPEPLWRRGVRWARRHRTVVTSTGLVAVTLLVGAIGLAIQRGRQVEAARGEALESLIAGREALAAGDLQRAEVEVTAARSRLAPFAGQTRLTDIAGQLGRLADDTAAQLAQRERRRQASDNLARFRDQRDEARFLGMAFAGLDEATSLAAAQRLATEALALFGVAPDAGTGPPTIDPSLHESSERAEIAEGCYELLFLLADVVAQPHAPGSPDERGDRARRALAILDRARSCGEATHVFHLRRSRYLRQLGQTDETEREESLADQTPPTRPLDHFLVGDERYLAGNLEGAVASFEAALRLEPDHFWAQYFLGVCRIKQKRPSEAVAVLTASASHRPDFVWVPIVRGLAYGELGDWEAALADFDHAETLQPTDWARYAIYLNRAFVRIRANAAGSKSGPPKLEAAAADLARAIELRPNEPGAYINLAEVLRRQGKPQDAIARLEQAMAIRPDLAQPYRSRARIRLQQKDLAGALADFEGAVRREPPASRLRADDQFEIGRILQRQQRIAEAASAFESALAIDPDHPLALRLHADVAARLGRHADALASLDRVIELYSSGRIGASADTVMTPDLTVEPAKVLASAYRSRGLLHALQERPAQAMRDYARAEELAPDALTFSVENDRALFGAMRARRGWAYLLQAGPLALRDFEEAIRIDPGAADPYAGRGYARVLLGQYREGIADAEAAVERAPQDPGVLANCASIYAQALVRLRADPAATDRPQLERPFLDRAIDLLRRSLERLPAAHHKAILADPALDPIRSTPEFGRLNGPPAP